MSASLRGESVLFSWFASPRETRVSRIDEMQQWRREISLGIVSIAVVAQSFLDVLPALREPVLLIVVEGRGKGIHNGTPLIRHRYLWSTPIHVPVLVHRLRASIVCISKGHREKIETG